MKANGAPEKLYLLQNGFVSYCRNTDEDVEYCCTNAFIEKATQFLYDYNQKQVLKHGAGQLLVVVNILSMLMNLENI